MSPEHASGITRPRKVGDHPELHTGLVGRPGLDPGTCGLRELMGTFNRCHDLVSILADLL
jgi:hypothetical protein